MRIILALLAAIVLSACGGTYFNPAVTQAQAERDLAECRYQVNLAAAGYTNHPIQLAAAQGELIGQCLNLRGYHRQ
jgi:hypothetical protein